MTDINWLHWNWRMAPEEPRAWAAEEPRIAIVDGMHAAIAAREDAVVRAMNAVEATRSATLVMVEPVSALQAMKQDYRHGVPRRLVPALKVERQADLSFSALRALSCVRAAHRALVISPREEIDLDPPWCSTCGPVGHGGRSVGDDEATLFCTEHEEELGGDAILDACASERQSGVNFVIVCGPVGPDAWPMHPSWIRSIRNACATAGVAFAFTGWGEWKNTGSAAHWEDGGVRTEEERGVAMLSDGRILFEDPPAEEIRARDRAAGHHVHQPSIERDRKAIECMHAEWRRAETARRAPHPPYDSLTWFYRVGAERSGRILREEGGRGGAVHLNLPDGLRGGS